MSYDARYYAHYKPVMYAWDQVYWLRFFDRLEQVIVATLNPQTTLDAGCGVGFLVSALAARGVDAHGFDISEYAISQVPWWLGPRCAVGDITALLTTDYELITCIEVLEHLSALDGVKAIANLCAHTDLVLFSSTPDDVSEPTHINVQPPEYWAAVFDSNGFMWREDYDARYISPHARLYARR